MRTRPALLAAVAMVLAPWYASAQTETYWATAEYANPATPAPPDLMTIFNPASSGKPLVIKRIEVTVTNATVNFDIWPVVDGGSGCRQRQKIHSKMDKAKASIAEANSNCALVAQRDLIYWADGPFDQFIVQTTYSQDPLDFEIPPGSGIRITLDGSLPSGKKLTVKVVWKE